MPLKDQMLGGPKYYPKKRLGFKTEVAFLSGPLVALDVIKYSIIHII